MGREVEAAARTRANGQRARSGATREESDAVKQMAANARSEADALPSVLPLERASAKSGQHNEGISEKSAETRRRR
jgi:BMFP domain-containing protein YqiC